MQEVSKILGEVGVERGCWRLEVREYRREWAVRSLGFDQELLGQPGLFLETKFKKAERQARVKLGWDMRMPRKSQVVFGQRVQGSGGMMFEHQQN